MAETPDVRWPTDWEVVETPVEVFVDADSLHENGGRYKEATIYVPLRDDDTPDWTGLLARLRLDPAEVEGLRAEVERLRAALQKRLVTEWRSGTRVYYQCDECGQRADAPERIEHIACPLSDATLAERGGEG